MKDVFCPIKKFVRCGVDCEAKRLRRGYFGEVARVHRIMMEKVPKQDKTLAWIVAFQAVNLNIIQICNSKSRGIN